MTRTGMTSHWPIHNAGSASAAYCVMIRSLVTYHILDNTNKEDWRPADVFMFTFGGRSTCTFT